MKKNIIILAAAALLAACSQSPVLSEKATLSSPDGNLTMSFALSEKGEPMYSLRFGETDVVLPSRLGFELRGSLKSTKLDFNDPGIAKTDAKPCYPFNCGFSVTDIKTDSFDETWEPVWGEEKSIRNHYNELLVCLCQDGTGRRMNVRFRLFDDGLGFRYEFPGNQELNYFVIKEELTEFAMAGDHKAWWTETARQK